MENKEVSRIKCNSCDDKVAAVARPEATLYTLIPCLVVVLVFGLFSVLLLPVVILLTKSIVYRCTKCNTVVKSKHPLGLESFSDEVVTFKVGGCAIILSRTYLLGILAVMVFGICFFWVWNAPVRAQRVYTNLTWPDYLDLCGSEVYLKNSVKASLSFAQHFEGKTVEWQGYMMKTTENNSVLFRGEHSLIILVKMQPTESEIHADLILTMNDRDFARNVQEVASLDMGSLFKFNATFVSMGTEQKLHHLHAHEVKKLEGHLEIPSHVHKVNQRYNVYAPTSVSVVEVKDKPKLPDHNDTHIYKES